MLWNSTYGCSGCHGDSYKKGACLDIALCSEVVYLIRPNLSQGERGGGSEGRKEGGRENSYSVRSLIVGGRTYILPLS